MKKILVPTDFSPIADNALKYAIEIAAQFKSQLYLYHVYYIHKIDYNLNFPEDEQPLLKQAEHKMYLTKLKFKEKITQKGLSIQTVVEKGDIFSLFKRKVKKHGINLIVMGSKGASGLKKVIFGSVAGVALDMAKVPVLIIPPGHSFRPFEHIVMAMDNKEVATGVLSPLQKLASKSGAKVTMLNVKSSSDKKSYQKIDLYLDGIETTNREVPISSSINETINEFIRKEGCDLLCMVRREKGFIESIFQKSITKNQAFNSHVPLLVLPEV